MHETLSQISRFEVTGDGWMHGQTNTNYITVTVQFIDKNFATKSCILATVPLEEKHTANCIKTCVLEILNKNQANRNTNVFVTDNAANMRAAFKDYSWLGCSCHNLNLVLSHGLQKEKQPTDTDVPGEVFDLISTCKELITLAK